MDSKYFKTEMAKAEKQRAKLLITASKAIRKERLSKEISLRQLGLLAEVDSSVIFRLEKQSKFPSNTVIEKILKVLFK